MHCTCKLSDSVYWTGGCDRRMALFENLFPIPHGITYNSYLIMDEHTALIDTVDASISRQFLENVLHTLNGRPLDYLVINHMEPDHCANIEELLLRFPDITLVGNAKTFALMRQFYDFDFTGHMLTVKEKDSLGLGSHTLRFYLTPMVHWPEVMMTYEETEKLLFSADAFGSFGALSGNLFNDEVNLEQDWLSEVRRYYGNIVGKYGIQVQSALKKLSLLDIKMICPLHGLVWRSRLDQLFHQYDLWSRYEPESEGVLIAYASLHGNTAQAAKTLAGMLEQAGTPTQLLDLARCDTSLALSEAFRYGKVVLAASSYNGGVIPWMDDFLHHLLAKNYQKRTVGLMENGSWGPSAVRTMKGVLAQMKELTIIEPAVTLRGAMKPGDISALEALAKALMA